MKLEAGSDAPFFSRPNQDGEDVTLDDYAGHRLVIYFYPRAFTPGCTTESCDFRDRHEALYAAGYEIVGVSPDPTDKLDDFRAEHDLPFPLLSDEDHSMAEAYGAWGVKKNYGKEYEGLIRSTIVVDEAGKVEHAWYNVRAKGHVARVESTLAEV
ncbi:MAG TPA: thioredoxin-dependent thiol peroxidase [Acidimicrobiia bacterium]|nr:thioredoxin-dependent thiol peroxidase [Acidimicrobiia bacterium]